MSIAITLPDEVVALATGEGEGIEQAVLEAVVFQQFQRGRVSAGKAAELLHLTRGLFEKRRMELGVARPFFSEELERDLVWAAEGD